MTPRQLAAYAHEYLEWQNRKNQVSSETKNDVPDAVYIDQIW